MSEASAKKTIDLHWYESDVDANIAMKNATDDIMKVCKLYGMAWSGVLVAANKTEDHAGARIAARKSIGTLPFLGVSDFMRRELEEVITVLRDKETEQVN